MGDAKDRRTKAEILDEIDAMSAALRATIKDREGLKLSVANLQARCLTLRDMHQQASQERRALERMVQGLTERQNILEHESRFSVLNQDTLERLSKLLGGPLWVCSRCGRMAKAADGVQSGHRICPECFKKAEWPWPSEEKCTVPEMVYALATSEEG